MDTDLAALESKIAAASKEREERAARCLSMVDTPGPDGESPRGKCLREANERFDAKLREIDREREQILGYRADGGGAIQKAPR